MKQKCGEMTTGGVELVPRAGVEPATFRLGGGRSILLSYRGVAGGSDKPGSARLIRGNGGAEEDRTPDLRIANATLSQLSYGPVNQAADLNRRTPACHPRQSAWSARFVHRLRALRSDGYDNFFRRVRNHDSLASAPLNTCLPLLVTDCTGRRSCFPLQEF